MSPGRFTRHARGIAPAFGLALGAMAALGVIVALTLQPRPVGAAELEIPSPGFPTLQAGLLSARPGDVLRLAPGSYPGPVVVTKPVTLAPRIGAEGQVTLEGGGKGRVVEVRAPGVTLRGLTVRASGDDIEETDACIYVHGEAARVRIVGNTLEKCLFGIWVHGAAAPRIEDNRIGGIVKPIFSDRGNGINLWNVKKALVRGNEIRGARDGIYLSVSNDSVVRDNLMHHLRFGIHYMYNDRNRIEENVICRSQVGMALMFSKRLEIRGNITLDNRDHGILFRTILESRIVANRALGNGKGFVINDSSFNEITGNHVEGNTIGVHLTAGSENNRVYGNNFVANPSQVRFTWGKAIRWDHEGRGNFWSDYLGWDIDHDGMGDRIYHASSRIDRLMFRYPQMKLLAHGPVIQLMQALEARMPVLRPPSIVDRHPAMRPFPEPQRPADAFAGSERMEAACGSPEGSAGS